MATYEKKSWETLNLPAVSGDTYFRILDHYVSTDPSSETSGVIYDGLILDGFGIQNLDEILSQYIHPTPIIFSSSVQQDNTSHSTFYIYYTQDDWATWTYDTIISIYDWSYKPNYNRSVLSDPIINLVDNRQFFVYTIKAPSPDVINTITMKIDDIIVISFQISGYTYYNLVQDLSTSTYPGEFTYAYSYDFFVDRTVPIDGVNKITVGPSTYYVTNTCYRYCLYYLNQYGGWDSLLFRGREIKSSDLSRLSYKKNYIAGSSDFYKVDYLTTIQDKWVLNTSFLSDPESSKMMNLMSSNKLYIQDLEEGYIAPVNITNSNCELKNYKNQGRKMATYDIEVSASQPKYRI
jgi:hypothetical protein